MERLTSPCTFESPVQCTLYRISISNSLKILIVNQKKCHQVFQKAEFNAFLRVSQSQVYLSYPIKEVYILLKMCSNHPKSNKI